MSSTTSIVCTNCGRTKYVRTAEYNRQIRKSPNRNWFCSSACAGEFKTKQNQIICACPVCGKTFIKLKSEEKQYCSHRCGNLARFSTKEARLQHSLNIRRAHNTNAAHRYCEHCGNVLFSNQKRFCSIACYTQHHWESVFGKINETKLFPTTTHGETDRDVVRKYLLSTVGNKCALCGKTDVKLIVDHIDGNAMNSSVDNLRLLCDECDRTTPTYKNKPHFANRPWRRKHI